MEKGDTCIKCIKNNPPQPGECYQCGQETMKWQWDGCSVIGTCLACGASVVVASFFADCKLDKNNYSLTICTLELTSQQMIKLSKMVAIRVLELKTMLGADKVIDRQFSLREILPILHYLKKEEIIYRLEPKLPYSEIWECEAGEGAEFCKGE